MTIDEAIALLPGDSAYRMVIRGMAGTDAELRRAAERALHGLSKPAWAKPVVAPEGVALAVLQAVFDVPFPPPQKEWERGPGEIVFSLIGSAHPAVLDLVEARFGGAEERIRLDLLTLVASAGTRRGAEVLAALIVRHGWPGEFHARFFAELGKNLPHAEALFPALLEVPGGPSIELGDLLIRALRGGLDPALVASAPLVRDLGPHIEAFAVAAMLRRKEVVADATIARIAADPSVRAAFHQQLEGLGATGRIPPQHRTRDAFAAADMVEWLSHPGELGRPPHALEQMAVFEGKRNDEDVALYVWRFHGGDGRWKASVSGLYTVPAPEGPVHGQSTFSRFEDWDARSPQGHAMAILGTLREWARVGG
jgi:hypothetical protein